MRRRQIRQDYNEQVRNLQAELHAKVLKLSSDRDRKLRDIDRDEDKMRCDYYQWKRERVQKDVELAKSVLNEAGITIPA